MYLTAIIVSTIKYPHYSFLLHTISKLGTGKSPQRKLFNLSTSIYGLYSFILPLFLLGSMKPTIQNFIGIGGLVIICISTALIGLVPEDRNLKLHMSVGYILFSSIILTSSYFLIVFFRNLAINNSIFNFTIFILFTALAFAITQKVRPKLFPPIEWVLFVSLMFWNFFIGTYLLHL